MSAPFGQTTAPGAASTAEQAGAREWLALVIVWSAAEPHRVGEVAFFPLGVPLFIGRGDAAIEKFARWMRQRPGEMPAVDPREGILGGNTLSRRQGSGCSTGEALEVEQLGKCVMYVNGKECRKAALKPGDTLMFRNELVLLCVSRPRVLPALEAGCELHAYGEADAYGNVGESPVAWQMRKDIAHATRAKGHVLIGGESGTGKEMAAKVIHNASSRAQKRFVSENAATLTTALSASALCGNPANYPNPGAARKGFLGEADGGTLFLDEIGDCPLDVQAQLLRVMDQGEYNALGEALARRVDVRFVGATNKDDSAFRADFLARFRVRVRLPPLRERPEDIPLLVRHLLRLHGVDPTRVGGRFIDELVRHPLPTNVRQLDTLLAEAIRESKDNKLRMPASAGTTSAPPPPPPPPAPRAPAKARPGAPSREEVVACLEREEWTIARVARRLGIERSALYRLMKDHGIERESGD